MHDLRSVKESLETFLNTNIRSYEQLHGGDINTTYLIHTSSSQLVVKLNSASAFPGMFKAEAKGLKAIEKTCSFRTPGILLTGKQEAISFLLMEYIPPGKKTDVFWKTFGKRLALLHSCTNNTYGFETGNYIGSLPQYNTPQDSIVEFYITQRIEPQIRLADKNGYTFKKISEFYRNLDQLIPEEKPALIHGDLWNGNYLTDNQGNPCLIDPAVSYMHREADIAMMTLFGGFDSLLLDTYNEVFPLEPLWEERLDIWQLYYLLVHLNLFGSGYFRSVKNIIEKYC